MQPHVTAEFHNGRMVVFGCPDPNDESHNCDAMGCGSVGPHVLELLSPIEAAQELYRLRARVAEMEAPPVVPEGWQLRKIGAPEWRKWDALRDGKLTSWCGHVGDLPIVRALAWAIEHDERPPHAEDVGNGRDGVSGKDEVV